MPYNIILLQLACSKSVLFISVPETRGALPNIQHVGNVENGGEKQSRVQDDAHSDEG